MIGAAEGLTLLYEGLLRKPLGIIARAALIAPCTSVAALLMSRLRSNCNVMRVCPVVLRDVISVRPAIVPSERSRGVATVAAMTSGLAPGICARTEIAASSIWGKGAIGSKLCASQPASTTPSQINVVATGLTMKMPEMFMAKVPSALACCLVCADRLSDQRTGKSRVS